MTQMLSEVFTMPSPEESAALFDAGVIKADTFQMLLKKHNLDNDFVKAVIGRESGNIANALSSKGAQGLMQVMPATGAEVAQKLGMQNPDLNDPETNKIIGTEYLGQQVDKYQNPQLALAAYNAGPGAVDNAIRRAGSNDPTAVLPLLPQETQNYVPNVMSDYAAGPAAQTPQPQQVEPPLVASNPMAALGNAYDQQQAAVTRGAEIEVGKAQQEQAVFGQAMAQKQALQEDMQRKEAERQARLDESNKKLQEATTEFSNTTVDKDRFWTNASTPMKVVAALSVALSGVAQVLAAKNGNQIQENAGLKALNQIIERDVEQQKTDYLSKRDKIGAARNAYGDLVTRFGDERTAEQAMYSIALGKAQDKLTQITVDSKSDEIKNKAAMVNAQIGEERAKLEAQLQTSFAEASAKDPARAQAIQEITRKAVLQGVDPAKLPKEDRERYIPNYGFASSKEAAEEFKTGVQAYGSFVKGIDRLIKIRQDYGSEMWNTGIIQEAKTLSKDAMMQKRIADKMGALDKGSLYILEEELPDVTGGNMTSWSYGFRGGDPVMVALKALKEKAEQSHKAAASTLIERVPSVEAGAPKR